MKQEEFQEIISRDAFKAVAEIVPGDASQKVRDAHHHHQMLVAAFRGKSSVASVVRWLVVVMARTKSWIDCEHVDQTRWRGGFTGPDDFVIEAMTLAGYTERRDKYNLTSLASISWFAHDNDIDIDSAVLGSWTQVRDGIPSLRAAIDKEDKDAFEEIIKDTQRLAPDAFKDKYVQPRIDPAGYAAQKPTSQGEKIVIIVIKGENDMQRFLKRNGNLLKWGMAAEVSEDGQSVIVRIERAPSPVWSEAIKEAVG